MNDFEFYIRNFTMLKYYFTFLIMSFNDPHELCKLLSTTDKSVQSSPILMQLQYLKI